MLMITALVTIYYNVIIAWAVYYMFAGMQSVLPWSECRAENSVLCIVDKNDTSRLPTNLTQYNMSAPEDYFYSVMLGMNKVDIGKFNFCLLQTKN